MKRLFELGNQYVRESDWKDLALVKFCLCAMGIMIGTQVPTKHKKAVVTGALGVFVVTYIPLMAKLFKIAMRKDEVQQKIGRLRTSIEIVPIYVGDVDTASMRYYISETDKSGTPVNDSMNLEYTASVDKGSVLMSMEANKAEVVITNTFAEEVETEIETELETEVETETEEDAITGGSSGGSSGGVQTGDDTPIWLFAGLLAVSAVLIIVILVVILRRNRKKRG